MDTQLYTLSVSVDAEGEYWVTADPYPGDGPRPYGRANSQKVLRTLLVEELRLPKEYAERAAAEVEKCGRFTEIAPFPADLRSRLQATFDRQLRLWRQGTV